MLSVSNAIKTALSSETMKFAWLLKIGEDLRFTNHSQDISYDSDTYESQGDVLRLAPITREREIKLQSYTIEFSNVDGVIAYAMRHRIDQGSQPPLHDRTGERCEILLVLLDGAGAVIDAPISLYAGVFSSWVERDTATTASVSLRITSPWAAPNLTAGRVTSNNNQQDNFTGDRFFEFAHEEKNTIGWGAEA